MTTDNLKQSQRKAVEYSGKQESSPETEKSEWGSYRTSSLFHYTEDIYTLQSILKEGIKPDIAQETFINGTSVVGIPMVSFCDIPISRSATIMRYGEYSIGLSKNWGIKNNIHPIQYYQGFKFDAMHSMLFQRSEEAKKRWEEYKNTPHENSEIIDGKLNVPGTLNSLELFADHDNFWLILRQTLGYNKPYYGKYNNEITINYEENEWRYLVDDNWSGVWKWGDSEYTNWRGDPKDKKPTSIFDPLTFDIKDLNFIIVKQDSEVLPMVNYIKSLEQFSGRSINEEERYLLLTKIISVERIKKDF